MPRDSFDRAAQVPTSIGELGITLYVKAGPEGNTYRDYYSFHILDADGAIIEQREGKLRDHLSTAQKSAVASFLDAILTKAQGIIT